MCIRDRFDGEYAAYRAGRAAEVVRRFSAHRAFGRNREYRSCLLYTSDAADERSSVDLGGRRIIKKKEIGPICTSCFLKHTIIIMIKHARTL